MWRKMGVVALLLVTVAAVVSLRSAQRKADAGSPGPAHAQPPAATGLPRLVDLGSTSCVPCKMMVPVLESLRTGYAGKLQVDFIDVWKDAKAGTAYGVRSVPTQIIFDARGKELYRHTGYSSREDLVAKLRELGITPKGAGTPMDSGAPRTGRPSAAGAR